MKSSPVFIHSLFRAGSTYLFSAFRRSPAGYWCYQEPLHEYIRYAAEAPQRLLDLDLQLGSTLRHPQLQKPYFWEFYEVKDAIAPLFRKELSYDSFFAREGNPSFELAATYLQALLDHARGRPMLQCCRSFGRALAFRRRFGGTHIHLWRNPWDQWWSYQVDSYFDATNQLILNATDLPRVLRAVKELCSVADFHDPNIENEIARASSHRLNARHDYLAFYSLWLYSLIEVERIADVSVNIDLLSSSVAYRRRTLERLRAEDIAELDLSDCNIAQGSFGNADSAFFESVESDVHGLFAAHGYDAAELASALRSRTDCKPGPRRASAQLVEDAARVREVALRQTDRLAHSQREIEAHAVALECSRRVADAAEAECVELRDALVAVHDDIAKAREDLQRRVDEISILNSQVAELTSALTKRTDEVSFLKSQTAALTTALTKRTDEVAILQDKLSMREKEIVDAAVRTQSQHQAILATREYATNLESELSAARSRIDEIHREMTRWTTIANDINNHLQAVYATRSWRLTAPLRWLKRNFGVSRVATRHGWTGLVALVRSAAERLVGRSARFLQTRPALKIILVRLLARFPGYYQRLRSIAFKTGVQRTEAVTPEMESRLQPVNPFHTDLGNLDRYSPSVLRTYRLLVAARDDTVFDAMESSQGTSSN